MLILLHHYYLSLKFSCGIPKWHWYHLHIFNKNSPVIQRWLADCSTKLEKIIVMASAGHCKNFTKCVHTKKNMPWMTHFIKKVRNLNKRIVLCNCFSLRLLYCPSCSLFSEYKRTNIHKKTLHFVIQLFSVAFLNSQFCYYIHTALNIASNSNH